MKQLLDTTAKALIFLETEQRIDGSYISYTSSLKNDFKKKQELPATFINSLILQCLHKVSGSSAIKQKLTGYVLDQKSDSWTWNYLVPVGQKKYPDDLDDTVCALGALNQYNSDIIDGTVLGCFVQNLIMAERKPGGPYNTWLIDTLKWPIWKDVDLVVNANIGWFLSMQQVHLDGLMQYIDSTIETSQFCSSYYPDRVSVLYFLSRWYNGPKKNMLYRQAQDLSKEYARNNPLQLALLLSCCVHLEFPDRLLIRLAKRLKKMQHEDGCWDAIGFFVDPTQDNATYYGGSAALTTAFAIEALVSYESRAHPLIKSTFKDTGQTQYMLTKQDCELIGSKTLRQSYQDYIRAIIRHDNGQQVTKIATITAAACRQELSSKVSNHLNLGSLNGWLAYDIFDDILDQEDHPDQLSIANYASRAMLRHFQQAFPDKPEFSSYVESVLTTMDCANDWEVRQTRLQSGSDALPIHNLPDYGTALDSLWQRSWGHSLAPEYFLRSATTFKLSSN
jgi:hypothetical protein